MASKKTKTSNADLDCSLSQDCLDYLKINKQPFAADILTDSTFLNFPELDKIVENLRHQVQFSDLLLIVEGPFGSGKTSFFRQLTRNEIETTKPLPIQAEVTDTLVQIQQKISSHLQDMGSASYLDENLKSIQSFDQIPLLIIDNAHVLSDTTIQELFRYKDQLKQDHDVNLKLILFASDGLSDTLQKITSLQENKMYVQKMPVYSEKLSIDFVSHKLRITGYTGEDLLSEKDYLNIDRKSDGTALNLMHHAAKTIEHNIQKKIKPSSPQWVKGLIGLVAVILISTAAALYFGFIETKQQTPESIAMTDPFSHAEGNDATTNIESDTLSTIAESNQPTAETMIAEDGSDQSTSTDITIEKTITEDSVVTTALTPQETPISAEIEQTPVSHDSAIKELPTASIVLTEISQAVKNPAPKEIIKETTPAVKAATARYAKPTETHPAFIQLQKMGLQDAAWLLKQKNSEWTLQLLGAREPETLLSFSQLHKLNKETAWYKTWLKGQPYYVLVHGSYSSKEIARASIEKLPEKLQSIKPWVKSMKSVKDAIK